MMQLLSNRSLCQCECHFQLDALQTPVCLQRGLQVEMDVNGHQPMSLSGRINVANLNEQTVMHEIAL